MQSIFSANSARPIECNTRKLPLGWSAREKPTFIRTLCGIDQGIKTGIARDCALFTNRELSDDRDDRGRVFLLALALSGRYSATPFAVFGSKSSGQPGRAGPRTGLSRDGDLRRGLPIALTETDAFRFHLLRNLESSCCFFATRQWMPGASLLRFSLNGDDGRVAWRLRLSERGTVATHFQGEDDSRKGCRNRAARSTASTAMWLWRLNSTWAPRS